MKQQLLKQATEIKIKFLYIQEAKNFVSLMMQANKLTKNSQLVFK